MISREEFLKYIKVDKLYANEYDYSYCYYIKCDDCPFSDHYNKQPCRDTIKEYLKKRKLKEILK